MIKTLPYDMLMLESMRTMDKKILGLILSRSQKLSDFQSKLVQTLQD